MKSNLLQQRLGKSLIWIVGFVLILAGFLKLLNFGADDMIEGLRLANLIEHQTRISLLAIVCGVLLMVRPLRCAGLLMATAYWGGAIVAHMTYNDSVIMPASFLGLLWLGHSLSNPKESPFSD